MAARLPSKARSQPPTAARGPGLLSCFPEVHRPRECPKGRGFGSKMAAKTHGGAMHRSLIVLLLLSSLTSAQSLGEAARAARARKQGAARPNERVLTNESLETLRGRMTDASVKTGADASATTTTAGPDQAKPADAKAESKDEAAAAEEKKKALADDLSKTKT